MNLSKIVAIIPARGGSKGIPRKNIRPFAGFPLIAYSIAAALQAAVEGWANSQDRVALRRRLVGLLVLVESDE